MGNEASTILNDLQANIEGKIERFQHTNTMDAGGVTEAPVDQSVIISSDDLRSAMMNGNQDQKAALTRAILQAKEDKLPVLNDKQKAAIRSSWSILTTEIQKIGVLTFLHMFESHPHMKSSFKAFRNLSDQELQTNEIFHNHAARVVNVVKKVVEKLDNPEEYVCYLTTLGRKHIMYEAEPQLLDQMGFLLLTSIQATIEKRNAWSEETSDAWEAMLTIILGSMRKGMNGHG